MHGSDVFHILIGLFTIDLTSVRLRSISRHTVHVFLLRRISKQKKKVNSQLDMTTRSSVQSTSRVTIFNALINGYVRVNNLIYVCVCVCLSNSLNRVVKLSYTTQTTKKRFLLQYASFKKSLLSTMLNHR